MSAVAASPVPRERMLAGLPVTERHRVIVHDLPGLGELEPVDRLDPAAFAAWFSALLRLICDRPPALVAHSLGGSLAARLATEHGERLERLVSLGLAEAASARLGWPLHVVDAAGHVPHVEQPDAFLEALA